MPQPELRCLTCAARGRRAGCRRCADLNTATGHYARFRLAARALREYDEARHPAPDLSRLRGQPIKTRDAAWSYRGPL